MFKYIDNKTERSVEATIKTLATKDDIASLRKEMSIDMASVRKEIGDVKVDLPKEMGEIKADTIKWMFIFWVGQVGAMLGIALLFLKK
jgi:hypothetical protein